MGCGICSYDVYLASSIEEIIGIDRSPKIIRKALKRIKERNISNIHLVVRRCVSPST
ncbi:MAG: hypothetical protein DRJ03_15340 [Chloroflexi bacterium]|nr:MAG: hypothetical protein DRJ03_15340 [Chloroflexota bacterium]